MSITRRNFLKGLFGLPLKAHVVKKVSSSTKTKMSALIERSKAMEVDLKHLNTFLSTFTGNSHVLDFTHRILGVSKEYFMMISIQILKEVKHKNFDNRFFQVANLIPNFELEFRDPNHLSNFIYGIRYSYDIKKLVKYLDLFVISSKLGSGNARLLTILGPETLDLLMKVKNDSIISREEFDIILNGIFNSYSLDKKRGRELYNIINLNYEKLVSLHKKSLR